MGGNDRGLHIARGPIDVAIDSESELNVGIADTAARGHVIDIGNGAQMPFQWGGHRARHDLGARPWELRRHEDRGRLDLGQGGHRQEPEGDDAAQGDTERQQDRCDRSANEGRGDIHAGRSTNSVSAASRGKRFARRSKAR